MAFFSTKTPNGELCRCCWGTRGPEALEALGDPEMGGFSSGVWGQGTKLTSCFLYLSGKGVNCKWRDIFSAPQSSFWTHWFWCILVLLPFFCFTSSRQQNIALWGLFSSRKTKKVVRGETGWIERVGHRGHAIFSKIAELSTVWAGVHQKHPWWNGQTG